MKVPTLVAKALPPLLRPSLISGNLTWNLEPQRDVFVSCGFSCHFWPLETATSEWPCRNEELENNPHQPSPLKPKIKKLSVQMRQKCSGLAMENQHLRAVTHPLHLSARLHLDVSILRPAAVHCAMPKGSPLPVVLFLSAVAVVADI